MLNLDTQVNGEPKIVMTVHSTNHNGGNGQHPDQVSCDWRRAGHVTTVLPSDWSRARTTQTLTSPATR